MEATILSGPPQALHTSGSAGKTFEMSRARLAGEAKRQPWPPARSSWPRFVLGVWDEKEKDLVRGFLRGRGLSTGPLA